MEIQFIFGIANLLGMAADYFIRFDILLVFFDTQWQFDKFLVSLF